MTPDTTNLTVNALFMRDLDDVLSVETLRAQLNPGGVQDFEAVATEGTGVFETLKSVSKLVVKNDKTGVGRRRRRDWSCGGQRSTIMTGLLQSWLFAYETHI